MNRIFPPICRHIHDVLVAAIQDAPVMELCGLLTVEQGRQEFRRLQNLGGPGEFWIDQLSFDRTVTDIVRTGGDGVAGAVLGFVHTHVHEVMLSADDEASLESCTWPWLVIVPCGRSIIGMWHWRSTDDLGRSSRHSAVALIEELPTN